jgi:hypothetical protein
MKYFFLTVIAALTISANVCAQGVHIGIKGGANLSDVYNSEGLNYDYKFGFHGGLLAHIHIAKHFAIQPEVVYSRQGARFHYQDDNAQLRLNYINVPVLFQYMFGNGFRLQAGPQVGFLVNSALKNDDFYYSRPNTFNKVDFAAAVGASYVSAMGLGIDARYVHGFIDVTDGPATSTNRGFQLGLFYLFNPR